MHSILFSFCNRLCCYFSLFLFLFCSAVQKTTTYLIWIWHLWSVCNDIVIHKINVYYIGFTEWYKFRKLNCFLTSKQVNIANLYNGILTTPREHYEACQQKSLPIAIRGGKAQAFLVTGLHNNILMHLHSLHRKCFSTGNVVLHFQTAEEHYDSHNHFTSQSIIHLPGFLPVYFRYILFSVLQVADRKISYCTGQVHSF